MQIKVLGSGSTGNCYYVKTSNGGFLLDAGVRLDKLYGNVELSKIDFCFISHKHKDHSAFASKLKFIGIDVIDTYAETLVTNEFKGIKSINKYKTMRFPIKHGEEKNNGLIVTDLEENETLIYLTDFNICEYNFKKLKIDHILIECNYLEEKVKDTDNFVDLRRINTHMGLDGCIDYLSKAFDMEQVKDI